jgi:hypothetical protein
MESSDVPNHTEKEQVSKESLYPHTTYRTGFRIAPSEETVAWKVLDFEYTELGNDQTQDDVARFLGISPKLGWNKILTEFKKRYGDTEGEWVCDRLKDAIYYYDHPGEQQEIYREEYEAKNTIVNLGDEGRFVLSPKSSEYIGVAPKHHATAFR